MKRYAQILLLSVAFILALSFCITLVLVTTGSGLTMLYFREDDGRPTAAPVTTLRPLALMRGTPTSTPTPSLVPLTDVSTPTPTPTPEPDTSTPTAVPAETETPPPATEPTEVLPPTDTPLPPEPETVAQSSPPTETPLPTDTPEPEYGFAVIENETFPTGKANLDVFIAVTNNDNRPVSGYRVIGNHSSGMQVESDVSAGDWTENSGAMHYKAGNLKLSVPNSPGGVWTLQLVEEGGQLAAAPLELPFDEFDPNWYFVLYQAID